MIIACCGHEIQPKDLKSYWWPAFAEVDDYLTCGPLCPKCVKDFGAVEADSYDEAQRLIMADSPHLGAK